MKAARVTQPLTVVRVFLLIVSLTRGQQQSKYPFDCGREKCGFGTGCSRGNICICNSGYQGVSFTETDTKHCYPTCYRDNYHGCTGNRTCRHHTETREYRCECSEGYNHDPDTGECIDTDECAAKKDRCNFGLECVNTLGSFRCDESANTYPTRKPVISGRRTTSSSIDKTTPIGPPFPGVTPTPRATHASGNTFPPTQPNKTNSRPSEGNSKLIIGLSVGIGGAVIIVIIVLVVLCVRRRRHVKHHATPEIPQLRENDSASSSSTHNYHGVTYDPVPQVCGTETPPGPSTVPAPSGPGVFRAYEEVEPCSETSINPFDANAGVAVLDQLNSRTNGEVIPIQNSDEKILIDLYSNHKIPERKLQQKQQWLSAEEQNANANTYNTLYAEHIRPANDMTENIQSGATGYDQRDPTFTNDSESAYALPYLGEGVNAPEGGAVVESPSPGNYFYHKLNLPKV